MHVAVTVVLIHTCMWQSRVVNNEIIVP